MRGREAGEEEERVEVFSTYVQERLHNEKCMEGGRGREGKRERREVRRGEERGREREGGR